MAPIPRRRIQLRYSCEALANFGSIGLSGLYSGTATPPLPDRSGGTTYNLPRIRQSRSSEVVVGREQASENTVPGKPDLLLW